MSFAPRQFQEVAEHLVEHRQPASGCLRSAVSRAYYSPFLSIKGALEARGFSFPSQGEVHGLLLKALKDTNIGHLLRIREQLRILRGRRNLADYDLRATVTELEARDDLKRSRRLLESIEAVPSGHIDNLGARLSGRP